MFSTTPFPEPSRHFAVGGEVPVSGNYVARHVRDGRTHHVFLFRGERFPSCASCGNAVRFELLDRAIGAPERQSHIMVHQLPHPDADRNVDATEHADVRDNKPERASRRRPAPRAQRIRHGDYYADIIRDPHNGEIWIYVVQHRRSPDILALGTSTSKQTAIELATGAMRHLSLPSSGMSAAG